MIHKGRVRQVRVGDEPAKFSLVANYELNSETSELTLTFQQIAVRDQIATKTDLISEIEHLESTIKGGN